jgi:hypothetical protein
MCLPSDTLPSNSSARHDQNPKPKPPRSYSHQLYLTRRGGITVIESFDALSERMKANFHANPEPNPTASLVRRKNINLRIAQDTAWITFDQYGQDTGEAAMDMPGISRETRFLEKDNGEWKLVYVGWLLEGEGKERW